MGILNITPDSFFAPSRSLPFGHDFVEKARKMAEEGASILDVGGVSTRPGGSEISLDEELSHVIPVIEKLAETLPEIILSVDTYRSEVAEQAIQAGATMINDISGGSFDDKMFDVVKKHPVTYVLMHLQGTPVTMHSITDYQDLIPDMVKYFVNKLTILHREGIHDIVIDPGFGFSKTMEHNYSIIDQLSIFRMFGHPVMAGISRKSTLSKTIGRPAEETLNATTALHMTSLLNGASILRVHDVQAAMDTIAVYNKLQEGKNH